MEANKKTPNLIFTLILTTITVIGWVGFSIYQAVVKPQPVVVPPEILEPLDSKLDVDTLNKLKTRFDIDEEKQIEITPMSKPEENEMPKQSPTPENTPTINPEPGVNQ